MPTDGENERLLRIGMLANFLVAKRHEVVWWTSTFDHARKKHRFNTDTLTTVNDHYKINLLHSIAYYKNVSFRRIINHYGVAHKFSRLSGLEQEPDVILCSLPTLELCSAATAYGKQREVPVVLDVRDLWPDLFVELAPVWAQWFVKLLLFPMFRTVRAVCSGATAIVGNNPAFVDWGVNYAKRVRTNLDRDFPMGYSLVVPDQEAILEAERFWLKHGVNKNNKEFIACYFGVFSRQRELETVVEAAQKLQKQNRPIRFVLCGNGDNLDYYKNMAKDCENVIFPGWVGRDDIWTLMRMSSVGLAPYPSNKNYITNLTNKPIEYLSAGLPIVSSLKGVLKDLLSACNCGVTYENGNSDELASILISLYDNPDRLKVMSKNASALYEEKFVAEKVYSEMISYLEEVCANYRK
ncbi:MAG: glycosyltransferase family 4 protein [Candidatus Brocadiales bacterium]|nr:glycosyltransferase family 4 protein [Candidatus Brocadiales bacterium]